MKALVDGLRALGPARLAAMGAVALGMLGMLALMVLRGGTEPMALLYGDLDLRDACTGGGPAHPPAHPVPHRRPTAARSWCRRTRCRKPAWRWPRRGCPRGGSVGYEIFDRSDGLAATEFQQKINETRAMEGELARTIRAIHGVRAVRVHLVLPQREPFAREQQEAQASVMLTMTGVARLDREGVQAILNLVAAAVPGLRPQNIAIVDSRGDLLARAGEPVGRGGRGVVHRGSAPRHRTSAVARGGGNAGAQPGRRPRARRGRGAHELRQGATRPRNVTIRTAR